MSLISLVLLTALLLLVGMLFLKALIEASKLNGIASTRGNVVMPPVGLPVPS